MDDSETLWSLIVTWAKTELKPENYELWFKPINLVSVVNNNVVLSAPNKFIRDWFDAHYVESLLKQLRRIQGRDFVVIWQVADMHATVWQDSSLSSELEEIVPIGDVQSIREDSSLLSRYTFDAFVVGPSNQLADAAANAVADAPASKYNPLFIYGGVGLGKTHLLHAIGHKVRKYHADWRIIYLKSETFMNAYINAVRNNKIEEFRSYHRTLPDILLMDDIQYLGGKERTQDEFFHTFNALFESHRQIVVTADKYPHEIPDLEERIRSRFQWGLIVDIQPPELETRIAILCKKAESEGIDLPSDVAYYLASNIKSNVRALEGLLIRVAAFSSLQQRSITLEFARETLKNFLTSSNCSISVEQIQKEVAGYFAVKVADLKSENRQRSIARPRQIAMFLSRKLCRLSYPELGLRFGGKDHTTVLAACRRIESLMKQDTKLRHIVNEIEGRLEASLV